jgi:hypothetical protein
VDWGRDGEEEKRRESRGKEGKERSLVGTTTNKIKIKQTPVNELGKYGQNQAKVCIHM